MSETTTAPVTTAPATTTAADSAPAAQPTGQPAAPPAAATDKGDFLAPKFAALARKEREIKAAQTAISAKEKEVAEKYAKYEAHERSKADWRKDPVGFIESSGLTIEELADVLVQGPKEGQAAPTTKEAKAIQQLQQQLEEMRNERAAERTAHEERVQAEARSKFQADMQKFVAENAEKYELVSERGDAARDLMYEVIRQHWQRTKDSPDGPEVMSYADAADLVEKNYLQESEVVINSKAKKIRALLERAGVPAKQAAAAASAATSGDVQPAPRQAAAEGEDDTSVEDWLSMAKPAPRVPTRATSVVLTNDNSSNMPPRQVVNPNEDAFQRAMDLLEFEK